MEFSDALVYLKAGEKITRKYWDSGKSLYIAPRDDGFNTIYFTNSKGSEGVYLASNTDILATDWDVVKVTQDAQV
jgi:hypothetical protein